MANNNSFSLAKFDDLQRYLEEISNFPPLSREEEVELAIRYRKFNDIAAANKMVTSHLRLVVKIAFTFKNYGLQMIDLISEGNIGLLQAVKKYDPDMGYRFSTYATWWVKAAIGEYVIKSWSLVKIGTTVNQKKIFFNLRKLRYRIKRADHKLYDDISDDEADEIAQILDVNRNDIISMHNRMNKDISLNSLVYDGEDELINLVPDLKQSHEISIINHEELHYKKKLFNLAFNQLTEREQEIIKARRLSEPAVTFEVLSHKFNISKERVRQIEEKAIEKLMIQVQKSMESDKLMLKEYK